MPKVNEYNYQQIHDRKLAESICVAAVVQVMAFDSAKMTVDVQPLSKHLENGSYESDTRRSCSLYTVRRLYIPSVVQIG